MLFEARVRGSAVGITEVRGPEGGEIPLVVTSEDLAQGAVDWTAFITFAARSWPPIRLTGSLSNGSWAAVVSPGSWVRSLSLFAAVLDESGHVVPSGPGDVVTAEIRYEAPFLDGGVLTRAFGLPGGGLSTVDYPSPPGAADTTLRLTVQVARNGTVSMTTRTLRPDDSMVQVSVAPDATVTLRTNTDPTSEEGGGADVVRDLALAQRVPEEATRPMVWGPARWPASSSDPVALDLMSGSNPFWAVELATDPTLMLADWVDRRTAETYWWDGLFRSGDRFTVPQDAWDAVGVAGRVYYRVFSSAQDTGWADWAVSTDDADVASMPPVVVGEEGPSGGSDGSATGDADVVALCSYLGIGRDDFTAGQDRYDDGIPGEDTLWALNAPWSKARRLTLVRVPMDLWTPPGVSAHVEDRHGYGAMSVRSDVAPAVAALRAELNLHGVRMTSSGAARSLDAEVTAGRSSTSIHYSAVAFDLATVLGMTRDFASADATNQLYVVTEEGTRWRVWARSASGDAMTLDAVEWRAGATSTRTVSDTFLDVTATCAAHGFVPIGPRSSFPGNYLSAEWWHWQNRDVLVPWVSQFGAEILALDSVSEADLQDRAGLWASRMKIFQRGRDGWW